MKVSCMQPYLFPYLGYFQLIAESEHFIYLDHVNFIKKGWINRNRIKGSNGLVTFTVPLTKISQNKSINDTFLSPEYGKWRDKFLKQIQIEYKKAQHVGEVTDLVADVLNIDPDKTISDLAIQSIEKTLLYLGLDKSTSLSSTYPVEDLRNEFMIVELCKLKNATTYINPIGGRDLYNNETFSKHSINLKIHAKSPIQYDQLHGEFVDNLSIIDIMMNCSIEKVNDFLSNSYTLE